MKRTAVFLSIVLSVGLVSGETALAHPTGRSGSVVSPAPECETKTTGFFRKKTRIDCSKRDFYLKVASTDAVDQQAVILSLASDKVRRDSALRGYFSDVILSIPSMSFSCRQEISSAILEYYETRILQKGVSSAVIKTVDFTTTVLTALDGYGAAEILATQGLKKGAKTLLKKVPLQAVDPVGLVAKAVKSLASHASYYGDYSAARAFIANATAAQSMC